jgi:hypothetical protein
MVAAGRPGGVRSKRRRAAPRKANHPVAVSDNWPAQVPVTQAELRVIETFLGNLINQLYAE